MPERYDVGAGKSSNIATALRTESLSFELCYDGLKSSPSRVAKTSYDLPRRVTSSGTIVGFVIYVDGRMPPELRSSDQDLGPLNW